MLKKICRAPGCTRLVDYYGSPYCLEHQNLEARDRERRASWHHHTDLWTDMYTSPKWQALRAQQLREQPQCEMCGDKATEVHHIVPHNGDWTLFLEPSNLMSICHSCHVKETARESREKFKARQESRRKLWY